MSAWAPRSAGSAHAGDESAGVLRLGRPGERRTSSGDEWLRLYRGGWRDSVPERRAESSWQGAGLGRHGAWSRTSVEVLAHDRDRLVVTAAAPHGLRLTRELELTAASGLEIHQVIANPGDAPVPYLLGEHPAFDLPPGTRLELPAGPVHVPHEDAGVRRPRAGLHRRLALAPGPTGDIDLSTIPAGPVERTCYLPDRAVEGWSRVPNSSSGLSGVELD